MDKLSKKLLRLFCLVFFFFPMKLHFLVLEELKRFSLGAILSFGKKSQLASNLKLTSTCTMTIYGEHGIMAHIPRWLSRSKHFVTPTLVSPQKCLRNKGRNSILMTQHYPDLGSAFNYWMKQIINQSENYPDLGRDSTEFLCSILRRHVEGKPVVALQNVGCYIMNIMNASSNSNTGLLIFRVVTEPWNSGKSEKFTKTHKIPRNSVEIL